MLYIKYFLNIPWTIFALLLGLVSLPLSVLPQKHAFVIKVRSFWWHPAKGVRAITFGNVVLLGKIIKNDLQHELIHVEQHMREPFVHPLLALIELSRKGYADSKYEQEAYQKSASTYKEELNA